MHIMHIALQGCLRLGQIDYGVTADTGGHIRYLLELVDALARLPDVAGQEIVTRGFDDPTLGRDYARPAEREGSVVLTRLFDGDARYLAKEELWRRHEPLVAAFLARLGTMERRPDVIHAHYADAGPLAAAAKAAFGIPYVFTAHSLARVKRNALGPATLEADPALAETLRRRALVEEDAIAEADLVIASSRDEAEHQLPLYETARPERIRVNPPGCDLAAFRARPQGLVADLHDTARPLDDPDKPCLLALARPVRKKNLAALVDAYGGSPELQARANLVIYAGTRDDIDALEDENAEVMRDLLVRIDRHDLWGRVALPKRHVEADVPDIYGLARQRRGVFVNVALNEPFGLTFLEAAASGLPVIATNQGGPNDILERCGHGVLVDPHRPEQLAEEALRILGDATLWDRLAAAGEARVGYYDWARHAADYLADMRLLVAAPRLRAAEPPLAGERLLLSDIDNTLAGHEAGLARLHRMLEASPSLLFGIATGRSLHSALAILREIEAPVPRILVTSVGSEIYYTVASAWMLRREERFTRHIAHGWRRDAVRALLARRAGLVPQGPMEQRPYKLSYFAELAPEEVAALQSDLDAAGLEARVIYSHGRYLDILPRRAGKGEALRWLATELGIPIHATFAAGDSGNDLDMLRAAGTGIVVGNHDPEIAHLRGERGILFCDAPCAGAIVEGMERGGARRTRVSLSPPAAAPAVLARQRRATTS